MEEKSKKRRKEATGGREREERGEAREEGKGNEGGKQRREERGEGTKRTYECLSSFSMGE